MITHAIAKLQQVCAEALDTLREISLDQPKPASTTVSAAKTILYMAIKTVGIVEVAERVCRLEEPIR